MKMSGTVAIVADSTHLSHRNSVHLHEISDVSKPKSLTKSASEHRRATKPLMEKRRRARINHSLNELKSLILDALHKDPSRHSKLEKADILEMTVRYLQNLQKQQTTAALATDPNVRNKFREGFTECATEVTRYVSRIDGVETGLKQRLVSHLSSCVASVATVTGSGPPPTMVNDINNNNSTPPGTSGLFAFTFPLHHHLSSSHHDQSWSLLSPSSLSPGSSVRSVSPVDSESQDMNEKVPKSNNVPIWRPF